MARLSQKAWNNVLIFSMLILIVVLNYERLFTSDENDIQPIVPEGAFIVSMQINQLTFERIGTGWRVTAPSEDELPNINSEGIDQLISQWQRALIRTTANTLAPEVSASPPYIVSIWLAGEQSAIVVGLLKHEDIAYVVHRGDLHLLDFPLLEQLLPN